MGGTSSGSLYAAHFLFREGAAKEGSEEGVLFPARGVTCVLTRAQTVEQGRKAEEPRFCFGQEGHSWCARYPHVRSIIDRVPAEIEEEIEQLEKKETPSATEQARLKELKADLERINKKKGDWVEEHPEHRKLVFKPKRRPQDEGAGSQPPTGPTSRNLFKKNGLPRHPERSIYYDPVMNPYGLPPPGMPYMEKRE